MLAMALLIRGPFMFLGRAWDIHVLVFASMLSILSYQLIHMGVYAHTFAAGEGFIHEDRLIVLLQRHFSLEKWLFVGFLFFLIGLAINTFIFIEWFNHNFGALYRIRESVFSTTLLVIGLQTMFSSFFISLLLLRRKV
jgi:hypothetical protein